MPPLFILLRKPTAIIPGVAGKRLAPHNDAPWKELWPRFRGGRHRDCEGQRLWRRGGRASLRRWPTSLGDGRGGDAWNFRRSRLSLGSSRKWRPWKPPTRCSLPSTTSSGERASRKRAEHGCLAHQPHLRNSRNSRTRSRGYTGRFHRVLFRGRPCERRRSWLCLSPSLVAAKGLHDAVGQAGGLPSSTAKRAGDGVVALAIN